jgi:hypothetical protein
MTQIDNGSITLEATDHQIEGRRRTNGFPISIGDRWQVNDRPLSRQWPHRQIHTILTIYCCNSRPG